MGVTVFGQQRPENVKLKRYIPLVGSLCDYCSNAYLCLTSINTQLIKLKLKDQVVKRVSSLIRQTLCAEKRPLETQPSESATENLQPDAHFAPSLGTTSQVGVVRGSSESATENLQPDAHFAPSLGTTSQVGVVRGGSRSQTSTPVDGE